MLLDTYLTYKQKVFISIIVGMIWIYYRTQDYYKLLPRKTMFSVFFVGLWIYLNYYEPLSLPIGIFIMVLYKLM
jgi:hypothetical protein